MVRSFSGEPIDPGDVGRLLEDSLRAPTAGNSGGVSWLALEGERTATYWEHTTTADWRAESPRWPGLSRAPVVALALFSSDTYAARYDEPDKQAWGGGTGEWPVPYWVGDAAFAVMSLLLLAEDAGLAAAFLGNFRGERPLLTALEVPGEWRLFGTVLLGRPDHRDGRSASLDRPLPSRRDRVHRGHWQAP
jgi:nitroreductase